MRGTGLLLIGALLASMSAGPASASDAFPSVDPDAYCRMIMDSNPASWSDPGIFQTCVQDDRGAGDEARSRWKAATQAVREQCTEIGKLNGHHSFQLILGCIRLLEQRV